MSILKCIRVSNGKELNRDIDVQRSHGAHITAYLKGKDEELLEVSL
jgi:hypothetical protein